MDTYEISGKFCLVLRKVWNWIAYKSIFVDVALSLKGLTRSLVSEPLALRVTCNGDV